MGTTLASLVRSVNNLDEVRKSSLKSGDWIFVRTLKSLYVIRVLDGGSYSVSGGWFEKKGLARVRVRIVGCTWGGSAIKKDLVAACGLRIEFGNRLTTSPIQKIFVMPHHGTN
ncbi:MAG TPA: hypothetical protein VI758_07020 [Bacteroidota bacterium]